MQHIVGTAAFVFRPFPDAGKYHAVKSTMFGACKRAAGRPTPVRAVAADKSAKLAAKTST